jgi:N-methylhydantoinase B
MTTTQVSTASVADILDREVFQYRLSAITDEMSNAIRRAAFSPIIWDMLDYSCALLSPEGELISQADTIPSLLGILSSAFHGITAEVPLATWEPGDVVICNDPYRGCTHTPDLVLMSAVYHEGVIVAVAAAVAHHVDIGGKLPSTTAPDNVEVFAEGLQFPPMKLVERGKRNETAFRFIEGNVRNPKACIGDLGAQLAGCRTGEKRIVELVEHYGAARFAELTDAALAYGERYTRALLESLPHTSASAETYIEDDVTTSEPIKLVVKVTIDAQGVELDFTGTDAQRRNALNCPLASTWSMALYAVRCITGGGGGPSNGGRNRPVRMIVPKGSFLNPNRPAAVGNRHYAQQGVADLVLKALAQIAPERSAAGCHISYPTMRVGGFDTRAQAKRVDGQARYFIMHDILGGGLGAHREGDGRQAVDSHASNCSVLSAEVIEANGAVRVLRSELIPGSGGEGAHRGGLGIRRDYELLADDLFVSVFHQQGSERTAPWGAGGGADGRPARAELNPHSDAPRTLTSKEIAMPLKQGDVIRLESAGGGGFGKVSERPQALIDRDRKHGYA